MRKNDKTRSRYNILVVLIAILILMAITAFVSLAMFTDFLHWPNSDDSQVTMGKILLDDEKTNLVFNPEMEIKIAQGNEELISEGSEITITADTRSDSMYVRVKAEYILEGAYKTDAEALNYVNFLNNSFDDFVYDGTIGDGQGYKFKKFSDGYFYLVKEAPEVRYDTDNNPIEYHEVYSLMAGEQVMFMNSYKIVHNGGVNHDINYEHAMGELDRIASNTNGEYKIQITVQALQKANVISEFGSELSTTFAKAFNEEIYN